MYKQTGISNKGCIDFLAQTSKLRKSLAGYIALSFRMRGVVVISPLAVKNLISSRFAEPFLIKRFHRFVFH